jgi:hypothetical protein
MMFMRLSLVAILAGYEIKPDSDIVIGRTIIGT